MKIIRVDLGNRSYSIWIGKGEAPPSAALAVKGSALIVSDSNVDSLYGNKCRKWLERQGWKVSRAVVPAGEPSKDLKHAEELLRKAAQEGLGRSSMIVALGGGMTGDLSGFVAATYMRGIRVLQIPTTLLAMVDSSVGGKTGVNLPEGKNLVGAFHQPVEVLADLETLKTLPRREYASGLAEVVKYGVIWDSRLFTEIEQQAERLVALDLDVLENIVARCCEIKAEVVSRDEQESGPREILNFGHTLGHVLESLKGYGTLLHGEAVSLGMVYAAEVSAVAKGFSRERVGRLKNLLRALGLPVRLEGIPVSWDQVRPIMMIDKKSRGHGPRLVLAEDIGRVVLGCEVDERVLADCLAVMAEG